MLQPLFDYLRTLTSSTFPTGLLVLVGGGLLLSEDVARGLHLLGLAIAWSYLEAGVRAYGVRVGQPTMSTLKFGLLCVCWVLVWVGIGWSLR